MKKSIFLLISMIMILSMGSVCMAAEGDIVYGNADGVIIDRSEDDVYPVADEKIITDGHARVDWGKGELHVSDPLFGKPSAYAETYTYSGTAYCIYAQAGMIDDESNSYLTEVTKVNWASSTTSATLLSPTKKCEFIGCHGIQDTSSSKWQETSTYHRVK